MSGLFSPLLFLICHAEPELDHIVPVGHEVLPVQQLELEPGVLREEFMLQELLD